MAARMRAKWAALAGAALLVFALDDRLRLTRHDRMVDIEIIHAPKAEMRWISVLGSSPDFAADSLIQAEGEHCAVIHRLTWRVPQVGSLTVRVEFRDGRNRIMSTLTQSILLGAEP